MARKTLHIVDGESTGGSLRVAGFRRAGEILPWRDALYSGPVPAGFTLRQLSKVRAGFWGAQSKKEFDDRDSLLARYGQYDEIVLWFGFTSLCQLSLVQLLSWFAEQKTDIHRLALVAAYGGQLRSEQLLQAYTARQPVTRAQMHIALKVWTAFRSPSPKVLCGLLRADLRALPDLREAIAEMLQEYPGKPDGLSRLERGLLQSIHLLGTAKAALAVAHVITRHAVGDVLLSDMLRRFVKSKNPLLRFAEPFKSKIASWKFNAAQLTLTETGRRVLAGEVDNIALNGIDRWIGGVHLKGHRVLWRWDERLHRIVSTKK